MSIQKKLLWREDNAYFRYRIPGLVVTKTGTLLAYCEARKDESDWALMDILLFRSTDGGETFAEPIVMAHGTEQYRTVNNPVCIVGNDGKLHFLYCRDYSVNGGGVWYRSSVDDGITWTEAVEITAGTMPEYHNAFALGPGHGICTNDGTLLVPIWMVPKDKGQPIHAHNPAVISTLYSKDNGATWQLGEILPDTDPLRGVAVPDPNETEAAVTPDGQVYLNVRSTGAGYRAHSWSKTGIDGWAPLTLDKALPDPTCMGSVVRYAHGDVDGILAVNCAHQSERKNLTCRFSSDGGHTWAHSFVVDEGDAGYADTAVLPDGTICILYEKRGGEEDWLAKIKLEV